MNGPDDAASARADRWSGADYAQHSSLQAAMADEVLSRLPLQGDERLLDLGCGDGKLSARIAAQLPGGSVLGVDASADMVAFARQHFAAANISFEVADARCLDMRDEFDLLVSFNALHWVPQAADALRGMHRALKAKGRAHLRLVTRGTHTSLEAMAEAVRREAPWAEAFAGFSDPYLRLSASEYAALAESLGFRTLSLRSEDKRWDFQSEEAFFGFCNAGFGAWTNVLPGPRRGEFVEAVMRRYLAYIESHFGEGFVFHFVQTDIVLAPGDA